MWARGGAIQAVRLNDLRPGVKPRYEACRQSATWRLRHGGMDEWDGLPKPRRYWSIAAIWLALTMAVLDASIANVALPTIARDLNAAPAESIWVINAYQMAIVVSLLPLAALGEIVGYRRVFQAGLVLFVIASGGCALAHALPQLAFARAVQGLGAAGVMSVNGALVRYTYPHRQLGRGVGLNALVISVAAVVGPSAASAILAVGPWQWLFAINLPVGLAALSLAWFALPESARTGRGLDWVSAALNVLAFGLVIVGIDGLTRGAASWIGVLELAGGALAAALLIHRSFSQSRPMVPIDLLRGRLFSLSILTSIASFAAQMLAFVALPFFFQDVLHRSQVETGLLITPWPLAVGVAAPLSGHLADRFSAAVLGSGRPGSSRAAAGACRGAGRDLANGGLRGRLRRLSGPQQPDPALGGAARPQRGGRRDAGHGPPDRSDHWRDPDRDHVPGGAAHGGGAFADPRRRVRGRRRGGQRVAADRWVAAESRRWTSLRKAVRSASSSTRKRSKSPDGARTSA